MRSACDCRFSGTILLSICLISLPNSVNTQPVFPVPIEGFSMADNFDHLSRNMVVEFQDGQRERYQYWYGVFGKARLANVPTPDTQKRCPLDLDLILVGQEVFQSERNLAFPSGSAIVGISVDQPFHPLAGRVRFRKDVPLTAMTEGGCKAPTRNELRQFPEVDAFMSSWLQKVNAHFGAHVNSVKQSQLVVGVKADGVQ